MLYLREIKNTTKKKKNTINSKFIQKVHSKKKIWWNIVRNVMLIFNNTENFVLLIKTIQNHLIPNLFELPTSIIVYINTCTKNVDKGTFLFFQI